jgi:hypothetical protein
LAAGGSRPHVESAFNLHICFGHAVGNSPRLMSDLADDGNSPTKC